MTDRLPTEFALDQSLAGDDQTGHPTSAVRGHPILSLRNAVAQPDPALHHGPSRTSHNPGRQVPASITYRRIRGAYRQRRPWVDPSVIRQWTSL
jgi:hypothetical protein